MLPMSLSEYNAIKNNPISTLKPTDIKRLVQALATFQYVEAPWDTTMESELSVLAAQFTQY